MALSHTDAEDRTSPGPVRSRGEVDRQPFAPAGGAVSEDQVAHAVTRQRSPPAWSSRNRGDALDSARSPVIAAEERCSNTRCAAAATAPKHPFLNPAPLAVIAGSVPSCRSGHGPVDLPLERQDKR